MNQQLLDKILGEFERRFADVIFDEEGMHVMTDKDKSTVIPVMNKNDISCFLTQALTTIYQAGQEDLKKKIFEEMVEEKDIENHDMSSCGNCTWNECREEIMKLIERI